MERKKTVFIITGPTAVGKSAVALDFAEKIGGEIVNCDSIQLYKYMDIGSVKPSDEDLERVKHHLISIINPAFNMTAAIYQKLAFVCIDNILERGKIPVICGGTGLYLNSILYKMDFAGEANDGTRRKELEEMARENGNEYMHHYLAGIDPELAEKIHPNNIRKVIRAIEAFELGNGIKAINDCEPNHDYDFQTFALRMDRAHLYERINNRVDEIMKNGFLGEVKFLIKYGFKDAPALKAIGYKELLEYLDGGIELEDAVEKIKKNTRHYAKRQFTWFNRYDNFNWIDVEPSDTPEFITSKIFDIILANGD